MATVRSFQLHQPMQLNLMIEATIKNKGFLGLFASIVLSVSAGAVGRFLEAVDPKIALVIQVISGIAALMGCWLVYYNMKKVKQDIEIGTIDKKDREEILKRHKLENMEKVQALRMKEIALLERKHRLKEKQIELDERQKRLKDGKD